MILKYIDKELENFMQRTGIYPKKIIISKETKDKIFAELEPTIDNCWKGKKTNYRGMEIKIEKDIFIELKG